MKNSFRNAQLYAFSLMVALTMFGCGLEEENPPAGGTSLQGNASTGKTLFTSKGCSGCHGADATGGIGPNIQGDSADHILSMAARGSGQMPSISLTAQEAADISEFLATVGTEEAPEEVPEEAPEEEEEAAGGEGDAARGAQLFIDKGCFVCHGADATGIIGPNIQGDTIERIEEMVGVAPPMQAIELTPQDRLDIVAWLQTL